MSAAREKLEAQLAAVEHEAWVANRNDEPMHEQELLARVEALRDDLADLEAEEASDEAFEA